jgi:hypothetical protein
MNRTARLTAVSLCATGVALVACTAPAPVPSGSTTTAPAPSSTTSTTVSVTTTTTSTSTTVPAVNFAKCPSAAAGQVRVMVVVDATAFGAAAPSIVCVVVAQGSSGITALAARAARLGTPAPRYSSSGLLCAIDSKPVAPACGQSGPNGYEYWTYWVGGTASWTFATVGPASRQMQDGTVEGWRFIPGGSVASPGTSSLFAQLVA